MKSLQSGWRTGSLVLFLLAGHAPAAVTTWDPQGTTAAQPGSGTWENASWSTLTSEAGMATPVNWIEGIAALFAAGSSTTTPAFTVTMNSTHTVAGIFNGALNVGPCPVTIAGTGAIVLPASTQQGFESGTNASTTINVPITGAATLVAEGHGQLYLNAVNTYSGGTILGFHNALFTGNLYFNNNSSFGTGFISMTNGSTGTLVAEGSGPYTIANAVNLSNITFNIVGTPAGVNFSGPWDTGHVGPCTLGLNGAANNIVTISGTMSDSQGFIQSGGSILVLTGNNSYGSSGTTEVSGGTLVLANTGGSATGASIVKVDNTAATLTGNGTATGTVNNYGSIAATNLAGGTATLTTGSLVWQPDSIYQWAINNTTGTAGATPGWNELVVNGSTAITATLGSPLALNLISLNPANQSGALAAFDNTRDYSWLILHSTTPPITGFSTTAISINSGLFLNAMGPGAFSVSTNNTSSGGDLFVNFVNPPVLTLSNVTVTAGSDAVFYATNTVTGSTPATASYSWKSNNVTLSDGGRISGSSTPTLIIANAQTSDDATYTVLVANAAGAAFVPATLTVTVAAASVSWGAPAPITYGVALTTNQLNATASVPGAFAYNPPGGAILNAGTNTLSVLFTPTDTTDYSNVTQTVSLLVLPAPLTVAANNATRPPGTANPVFTGSITGLQNGDNITATYSCSATTGSPLGTYPIVPALVDPNNRQTNYSVSLVNGTLAVGTFVTWTNPAAITYGAPLGSNQLDATANVPGTFSYNPNPGTVFDTGTRPLSVVFTPYDTTDYNAATNSVSLVVAPAPLTIAAANVIRQAGTANPVFTGTITGLQNGDNITATYSCSANSASPAGPYPIVPAVVDPDNRQTNYSVNLVNGTLTITPPPPPITVGAPNIIPLPVTLQTRAGIFTLCPPQPAAAVPSSALMQILVDSASQPTGQYLASALFKSTGYQFQVAASIATNAVKGAILITTANAIPSLNTEGYELTVAPDAVVIRAPAQGGAFYGVQSFLQLLPPQIYSPHIVTNVAWVAPCVYIEDYPQYSWRGVMLDVARHFFNKDEVKRLVDDLAMHKLNTLHLHLVDDQGWRFQLTNYPNLSVTAFRTSMDYGLPPRSTTATNATGLYGGYYTQDDCRELVAYAAERHITVVPEIEMPCHSTCGLAAYPQFGVPNPTNLYNMDYPNIDYGVDLYSLGAPGTMDFLKDALTEVMAIFPSKYIHCGGDEVVSSGDTQWNTNTADVTNMQAIGITPNKGTNSIVKYQHWLSTNIAGFLQANGRMMMSWTEFENGGIIPNAALMDWQSGADAQASKVASAGWPVVVSYNNSCYINNCETNNFAIEPTASTPANSLSTVYGFNPIPSGLAAQYQSNILGAQCSLWGENVPSFENVMFKMFPRESAMAEITWTPLASQNFTSFTNRLVVQKQRFAQMGLNYDHEAIPKIATWGPSIPTSPTTFYWDITTNVTAAGEIDVNFWYTSGADGLSITSVALLQNDVQVDIDVHAGFAGATPSYPLYIVHLPETKPGATYTIQAVVQGSGGTASSGTVYLPNWN